MFKKKVGIVLWMSRWFVCVLDRFDEYYTFNWIVQKQTPGMCMMTMYSVCAALFW